MLSQQGLLIISSCSKTPGEPPIDHNSSLEGYVTFEDGSPDGISANIILYRQGETNAIRQTQSDTIGFYQFEDLTSGIFQINFFATEHETVSMYDTLFINETTIADTVQLNYIQTIQFKEITIDGEIEEGWKSSYINTHPSSWSEVNNYDDLYIARDNTNLYIVPEGHFFVMGDNRDNSQDSRFTNIVGYIPIENLVGKAQFIFFSLENSRFLELWKWPKAIRTKRLFMQIQ